MPFLHRWDTYSEEQKRLHVEFFIYALTNIRAYAGERRREAMEEDHIVRRVLRQTDEQWEATQTLWRSRVERGEPPFSEIRSEDQ